MTTESPESPVVERPQALAVVRDAPMLHQQQRLSVFADGNQFETAMRMAEVLSSTSMVPNDYRREYPKGDKWVQNPDAQGNCIIALDMANRLGVSPLLIMQQVDMVHGRPGLRGAFMGALVNASKLFSKRLKFHFEGEVGKDGYSCYAYTYDHDGELVKGTTITWAMIKAEGWLKNSKWTSMPEQMIQYRAAAFFSRVHAADVTMGLQTREEIEDIYGEVVEDAPKQVSRLTSTSDLQQRLDDAPDGDAPDGDAAAGTNKPAGLPPRRRKSRAATEAQTETEPPSKQPEPEAEKTPDPEPDAPAPEANSAFNVE